MGGGRAQLTELDGTVSSHLGIVHSPHCSRDDDESDGCMHGRQGRKERLGGAEERWMGDEKIPILECVFYLTCTVTGRITTGVTCSFF